MSAPREVPQLTEAQLQLLMLAGAFSPYNHETARRLIAVKPEAEPA